MQTDLSSSIATITLQGKTLDDQAVLIAQQSRDIAKAVTDARSVERQAAFLKTGLIISGIAFGGYLVADIACALLVKKSLLALAFRL